MNDDGPIWRDGGYMLWPLFEAPFYATGYPITEAYWAEVKVGGTYRDVLMQCFERRCLTYTPSNSDGWKVEAVYREEGESAKTANRTALRRMAVLRPLTLIVESVLSAR